MAVLVSPKNYVPVYLDGHADVVGLFALKNVSANDTADLASWYQTLDRAVVVGVDVFVEIAATITGTVVTMPGGLTNSNGYLLVWGSGA